MKKNNFFVSLFQMFYHFGNIFWTFLIFIFWCHVVLDLSLNSNKLIGYIKIFVIEIHSKFRINCRLWRKSQLFLFFHKIDILMTSTSHESGFPPCFHIFLCSINNSCTQKALEAIVKRGISSKIKTSERRVKILFAEHRTHPIKLFYFAFVKSLIIK